MIRRTFTAALIVGLLAASCSSDDESDATDNPEPPSTNPEPPSTDAPAETAATSTPATDPPSTDPPSTDPPATEATPGTEPAADGPAIAEVLGVATVEIVTPASGGGERPLLEWAAVEGAEEYDVVALTADGEPYWAWVGQTTSVVFGGGDPAGDAGQLAIVYGPLTWTVAAYDPDGTLLALSDRAPLAP